MPAEPQETTKTYLQINPIEECLKAIGIVHGPEAERNFRYIVARVLDAAEKKENSPPWTVDRIQSMLDTEVQYKDWKFVVNHRDVFVQGSWDVDLRLRAEWLAPDAATGQMEKQQSRWWPLSKHMVKTEIVQTALKCAFVAEEHEIRETFKYKGRAAYNSHIDIETLWQWAEDVDVRVDPRPEAAKNQRRE